MLDKKINGLPSPAALAAARRSEGERSEVERSGAAAKASVESIAGGFKHFV
jgi:hypothetical protein